MSHSDEPKPDRQVGLLGRILRWLAEMNHSTESTDTHDWDTKQEILRRINERHGYHR